MTGRGLWLAGLIAVPALAIGAPHPVQAQGPTGVLSGTLTSAAGPVAGVQVTVRSPGGFSEWGTTQSAVDGTWTIAGVPTGTVIVEFRDDQGRFIREWAGEARRVEVAKEYVVTPGARVTGVDGILDPGGHISGTVIGNGPIGFEDATVSAWRQVRPGEWLLHNQVGFQFFYVRPDGTYDLGSLETGTYLISVDHQGRSEYWDNSADTVTAKPISVTEGQAVTGVDFSLAEPMPAMRVVTRPVVKGKLKVGATLRVVGGSWSQSPTAIKYGWLVDEELQVRPLGPTLKIKPAWRGKKIAAFVEAHAAGFKPSFVGLKGDGRVR